MRFPDLEDISVFTTVFRPDPGPTNILSIAIGAVCPDLDFWVVNLTYHLQLVSGIKSTRSCVPTPTPNFVELCFIN